MRPGVNEYFLNMARLVASRSTCYRRSVGCVLVDSRNRVLATGYNGVPSGEPHCNFVQADGLLPNLCDGALSMSGTNLHTCRAIHSEMNALISCRDPQDIRTAYCTASPCLQCVGFLLNTACEAIVFEEIYPHPESKVKWERAGRRWVHVANQSATKVLSTDV